MARRYPTELVCDMAETYSILDWRSLPVPLAAALAAGLRDNSRVKMRLGGQTVSAETMLLATCADALKIIIWQNTKDGASGKNPPTSILSALIGAEKKTEGAGFDSPEEFKSWRNSMMGGDTNGRSAR